jgi:hypothetical protein
MQNKIRHLFCALVFSLLLTLSCFAAAQTEQPEVALSLYRNSGFDMGNDINGQWTVNAAVSQNVTHVEFYLDGELQHNDTVAPFSWAFDSSSYSEGNHVIRAVAWDVYGESAEASVERNFVGFPILLVVGVVAVAVVMFVVSLVVSWFWIKKKAAQRQRLKKSA